MSFIKRIKRDLDFNERRYGRREQTLVDSRSLRELIDNFEALDSEARALYPAGRSDELTNQLHHAVEAVFHRNDKNAEITLMVIMGALMPLMEERYKGRRL